MDEGIARSAREASGGVFWVVAIWTAAATAVGHCNIDGNIDGVLPFVVCYDEVIKQKTLLLYCYFLFRVGLRTHSGSASHCQMSHCH